MKAPWPETQREDLPATRNSCCWEEEERRGKLGVLELRGAGRCCLAALLRGRSMSMGKEPHVPDTAPQQLRAAGPGRTVLWQGASVCRGRLLGPTPGETPDLQHNLGIRARRTSGRAEINSATLQDRAGNGKEVEVEHKIIFLQKCICGLMCNITSTKGRLFFFFFV